MTSVAQSGLVVNVGSPPSAEVGVEQETLIANVDVAGGIISDDAGKVCSIPRSCLRFKTIEPALSLVIEKFEDEIVGGIGSQ